LPRPSRALRAARRVVEDEIVERPVVAREGGTARQLTKLGVDVEKLMPVIQASMIRSGVVDYKAPFVLKRDFTPNFPLRLMHKDIRLMLEAAKEVRVKLPALETVEEIYELASEDGHQDLDYAATLTLLEKWAGVEVKGASA
jgi:3-hydroxyisobutyrate dehydrogenase-like beta-hydroxyacid dehydrogenase